jgi:DNA-directed RNA polymerase specialized sigma subunit
MRIPEHKLNEIRKNSSNKEMVKVFFDSIFVSLDVNTSTDSNILLQIPDSSTTYNINILNQYLMGLMRMHLTQLEYNVLRMSYGLDCDKLSAKEISEKLDIKGSASYVRVSQIKKDGIDKLIKNVEPEQVVDYLG